MSELIREFNDAEFTGQVETGNGIYLVDFWAPWCGPCRMVAPILDQLAKEFEGKLQIVKVNVDENASIAQKYHIGSIPTLALFRNGTLVGSVVGALPKDQIKQFISSKLGN